MNKQMKKNKKGFTLVEMIVVIAIIGVLAAMMVPSLLGYIDKSNIASNDAAAATIGRAAITLIAEDPTITDTVLKTKIPDMVDGKGEATINVDATTQKVSVHYKKVASATDLTIKAVDLAATAALGDGVDSDKTNGYYPR